VADLKASRSRPRKGTGRHYLLLSVLSRPASAPMTSPSFRSKPDAPPRLWTAQVDGWACLPPSPPRPQRSRQHTFLFPRISPERIAIHLVCTDRNSWEKNPEQLRNGGDAGCHLAEIQGPALNPAWRSWRTGGVPRRIKRMTTPHTIFSLKQSPGLPARGDTMAVAAFRCARSAISPRGGLG